MLAQGDGAFSSQLTPQEAVSSMAADVHVLDVLAAAMRWPVLLPFCIVLGVVLVWFWLPRLLVCLLARASRRYVRNTSSGSTEFAVNAAGEQQTGDRS